MTSALFSPIRLAELELPNRVVISPMCQYSAHEGFQTPWHLAHYGSLAQRGVRDWPYRQWRVQADQM